MDSNYYNTCKQAPQTFRCGGTYLALFWMYCWRLVQILKSLKYMFILEIHVDRSL